MPLYFYGIWPTSSKNKPKSKIRVKLTMICWFGK